MSALALSISCGLVGGYVDVAIIVGKRYLWNGPKNFGQGMDFPWSVPIGHTVLLLIPGMVVATVCWARPRPMSLRAGAWLFATFALWSALLRLPFYGLASLVLASGLAWRISGRVVALCRRPWQARFAVAGTVGLLVVLAASSSGWRAVREWRANSRLPAPPSHARNAILIVWDAVRARDLSLYNYPRNTTPNLVRWARQGVKYDLALAPASWTYPSHTSFLTGYWPFQLISQWNYSLDAPVPTLAEHLAARGYLTAGFSGNTKICTYETRLDRGFTHFEDYPLTARSFLSRTVAGSWLLENVVYHDDFYECKWVRVQSRNAAEINRSFFDWLGQRPGDRPFFAYLNYFDAHEPYMPPEDYAGRFGIKPRLASDFRFLLDYASDGATAIHERDLLMAHDCYDDCIAFLDDQLGQLVDRLKGMGLLENTVVIVASDHGEGFFDHGTLLHGNSLFLEEIAVPLVILAPNAPAGRVVSEPVSLRDLPATVIDQLGLSAGSPLPGHSLAACWTATPDQPASIVTPAFSEFTTRNVFEAPTYSDLRRYGVQMSLVAAGKHYLRDGFGTEELYDLKRDPLERENLAGTAAGKGALGPFRKMLLDELNASPGAIEVENTYMKAYRQWLKSVVE